ncbi:stage III sporulation protein AE [Alloiococcus sp. CFN-8]|uniref:stage III sporulation protein AE n=1 Tax=Alloiococcus sp. CFN-8 TaxID=3416081 RepID=UPI003CEA5452
MKRFLLVLVLFLLLPIAAYGSEQQTIEEIENTKEINDLYQYINDLQLEEELISGLNTREYISYFLKNGEGNISVKNVAQALIASGVRELISFIKLSVLILVIAIIAALIKNVQNAFSNDSLSNIAYFACYGLLVIILTKSFILSVDIVRETISNLSDFMAALIPVLLLLLTTIGGISESAILNPIVITAVNLAPKIYKDIIIPLILAGFALQFANNISDTYKLSGLSKLIKQSVLWMQGLMITIVVGFISIKGVTANTLDVVTLKTAKFAVDNFIPIIGKAMSDAITTVAGYSLLLKGAVGTIGLLILLFIVITPIIKVFLCAMVYKLTAAFIEPISDSKIVACIVSAGDSLILLMSSLISVSVMFFIMIAMIAASGKSIILG